MRKYLPFIAVVSIIIGSNQLLIMRPLSSEVVPISSDPKWNLSTPIFIDDRNPATSWSNYAAVHPWCTGSGTVDDPYVLAHILMNAKGAEFGIKIQHSTAYFVLYDWVLLNLEYDYGRGISLWDVQNGYITECYLNSECWSAITISESKWIDIYFNEFHLTQIGIDVFRSEEIDILDTSFYNHNWAGVSFTYSNTSSVEGCSIEHIEKYGILISKSNTNVIGCNEIINTYDGIGLESQSCNNIVVGNQITNTQHFGIVITRSSHYNRILYNTLIQVGLGKSCLNCTIRNNSNCEIITVEDGFKTPSESNPEPLISGYFWYILLLATFIVVVIRYRLIARKSNSHIH